MLWFSEGATVYYEDLLLLRDGFYAARGVPLPPAPRRASRPTRAPPTAASSRPPRRASTRGSATSTGASTSATRPSRRTTPASPCPSFSTSRSGTRRRTGPSPRRRDADALPHLREGEGPRLHGRRVPDGVRGDGRDAPLPEVFDRYVATTAADRLAEVPRLRAGLEFAPEDGSRRTATSAPTSRSVAGRPSSPASGSARRPRSAGSQREDELLAVDSVRGDVARAPRAPVGPATGRDGEAPRLPPRRGPRAGASRSGRRPGEAFASGVSPDPLPFSPPSTRAG